jgi:hypothetical protein
LTPFHTTLPLVYSDAKVRLFRQGRQLRL